MLATGARLALPEPKRGLIPGWGGTQLLPRLVPRAIALELLLTGRDVGAEEALALGLANRVADDAVAGARELAAEICANAPDRRAPHQVGGRARQPSCRCPAASRSRPR